MVKFSIITICLNAGDDLLETVQASLEQSYENFEIIVKDGLSTDGSLEKLPSDPRIRVVRQKDSGIYDAMNQALDYICGDYVIFMNSGDKLYASQTLSAIAQEIETKPGVLYYGLCYNRKVNLVNSYPHRLTPYTCFRTMICHQSTIYAAELFREKRYDTSFTILADKELLDHLICERKLQAVYIDEIIVDYQAGGACENEKHQKQIELDNQRLLRRYYSPVQRTVYRFLQALTFPKLRSRLTENPKIGPLYYRILYAVYRLTGRKKD